MLGLAVFTVSCTDLEEGLNEDLTEEQAQQILEENTDVSALIQTVYNDIDEVYQHEAKIWALLTHSTDEAMPPTRGGDWDDNGDWRVLHTHEWNADHQFINNAFNDLLKAVFNATNVLNFNPSPAQAAEARFLRAFVVFTVAETWGQVPLREPGENLLNAPRVLSEQEAVDFVISEVNAVINDLPAGPSTLANKDAANAFLAKVYLNKGIFGNRANPSFDAADMTAAINAADAVINTGSYALDDNYFDSFTPDNDVVSSEIIFVSPNQGGVNGGNIRSRWFSTMHYNQNPGGWNGFVTLSDFYDKFEDDDIRKNYVDPDLDAIGGPNMGFLIGQQFGPGGEALEDRKGNPLIFTRDAKLVEDGDDLEVTGIRVVKYQPDYVNTGDFANNDYVLLRYADVLLMKAEASLRNGDAATALDLVNQVRTARNVGALSAVTLDDILDERGRELYWEGHRRLDLIRHGKFLDAWYLKPATGEERLLYPIPNTALAVNPNLTQNPGYN